MYISPPEISSRPAIMRSRVVFPQPEGPTSTVKLPWGMASVTSSMARFAGSAFSFKSRRRLGFSFLETP